MRTALEPVVTPVAMGRIDRRAIDSGIVGYRLMLMAGAAIAASVLRHYGDAAGVDVLCGPGNNGGDGYVAAKMLQTSGMCAACYSLGDPVKLAGDAACARDDWGDEILSLEDYVPTDGRVVIDALFGAGLQRDVEGVAVRVIEAVNAFDIPVIAADLPSGLSGESGRVRGTALRASRTVTFAAPKPGHFLLPGRDLCGVLEIADIGIPSRCIEAETEGLWLNRPPLWRDALPRLAANSHKYTRGHLGVFSGGYRQTGAARLAAIAGLRVGAGLVTVLSPASANAANAAHLTTIMLRTIDGGADLDGLLEDMRFNSFVLGPGFGVGEKARDFAERILGAGRALVLDADGITSFAGYHDQLAEAAAKQDAILFITPHQGEFARLFPQIASNASRSKVEQARSAARETEAIVVYKGADTVVADPSGRAAICDNAPPWLATAGSGDTLAGLLGGLAAQGMPGFEAACAAAWLHGEAANRAGARLIAEDLANNLPAFSEFQEY
ncbi:NAD(P)H-hydrate dehydratase [Hoeflea sp. WL0058]|uniref:Bifunctional NAD(P)H-hydrate repair enzyme n=1 Tax=Flavimaribacter sediminis TaxID=2865987 RepID=A0AAE2ZTT1_9HYPH|nr:NAD(P)H-hydrate dehydratase [Flavimaribacter sediminis]MBW8640435.1 NAD(P)H-hydrate dehydratase [Flavimaribacter sediminis]